MQPTPRTRLLAHLLLAALLLLLALRLTQTETLREPLNQKAARLAAAASPDKDSLNTTPIIGPAIITAQAAAALLLAAGAATLTARSIGFSRARLLHFLLLAALFVALAYSASHADNRFNALIGTADLATALLSAFALLLLLDLTGDAGRRTTLTALLALGTLWITKAAFQYLVEFPDVLAFVREHKEEVLRNQGILNDEFQTTLFLSRMNSGEITGFLPFSNVFATGLIAFLSLLAALLTSWLLNRPATPAPAKKSAEQDRKEISIPALCFVLAAALLGAGAIALYLTGSKGGALLGYAAVLATLLLGFFWKHALTHRRTLITCTLLTLALGTAALLAYGIRHDALPSKSLLFRWHYWTASVPIISQHPATGVGLNNFGDFYSRFKRPSSPEDVKDPHSFFVRLAAETGLPAPLLIAALLAWQFTAATRSKKSPPEIDAPPPAVGIAHWAIPPALALVWALLHFTLAEAHIDYNLYISLLFALVTAAAYLGFSLLLAPLPAAPTAPGTRYLLLAAALAAAAMLLYDQINMALVTGPVAMLFWLLLALASHHDPAPAPHSKIKNQKSKIALPAAYAIPLTLTAAALTLLFAVSLPIAAGTFPPDPAPFETAYIQHINTSRFDLAKTDLDAALARAPNSLDLRMHKIGLLRDQLHQPVADAIRAALALDHANARPRIALALSDQTAADLPTQDRITYLQQALDFNAQLPADEIQRLPPETIAQIQSKLADLKTRTK